MEEKNPLSPMVALIAFALALGVSLGLVPLLSDSFDYLLQPWICFAVPALVAPFCVRVPISQALSLHKPSGGAILDGILCALGGFGISTTVATVTAIFFPGALETAENIGDQLDATSGLLSIWMFVLVPALTEELCFRGLFLNSFKEFGNKTAVFLSAALFGAMHMSVYRFLPTAFLGILCAMLVLRHKSLWPAVVSHAGLNALVLVAQEIPEEWLCCVPLLSICLWPAHERMKALKNSQKSEKLNEIGEI